MSRPQAVLDKQAGEMKPGRVVHSVDGDATAVAWRRCLWQGVCWGWPAAVSMTKTHVRRSRHTPELPRQTN